jgi:hypothetical protein
MKESCYRGMSLNREEIADSQRFSEKRLFIQLGASPGFPVVAETRTGIGLMRNADCNRKSLHPIR